MRLAASVFFFVLGLVVAVLQLKQAHYWSGASAGALALLVPSLILLGKDAKSSFWVAGLSIIGSVSAICAIFFENRAFDLDLSTARIEAALALSHASSKCPRSDDLFAEAAKACFIQSNLDQMDAVNESVKSAYLPPYIGLADQAKSSLGGDKADKCAKLFKEAYEICPSAFMEIPEKSMQALLP
jgi:hypothetical protein